MMKFRLLDSGWDRILDQAVKADTSQIRIVCPFIKRRAAERFFQHGQPRSIQVITRFNLDCFREGVSDVAAVRYLLKRGALIRGVRNLHAKAYLVGKNRVVVTSANLTEQAFVRNHEFGFYAEDPAITANCHAYFDRLWDRAKPDLTMSKIDEWESKLAAAKSAGGAAPAGPSLGDDGADVGFFQESGNVPTLMNSTEQGFVKFFGRGNDRADPSMPVLEEVDSSTSHWALSYPTAKIPRSVRDGALMFIARLTKPNEIFIYGRAIALAYRSGTDDATSGDIRKRSWKEHWSRYIRVRNTEFVNATLSECVSLNEMMRTLAHSSFATTMERYSRGERDINPRTTYARQAQVELAPEAIAWLNDRLDRCFHRHGRISAAALQDLTQPEA